MKTTPHRIALVHDWLLTYRGGEKMLEALCELYPHAEIFTLFHKPGSVGRVIESHTIHTSFLDPIPRSSRYYRYLLPLFPLAVERFDLSDFDLILSTSHCVAKGVIARPDALHVSFCFTPMRYAWDRSGDYFRSPLVAPLLHYLRLWDVTSSARVDQFVAISEFVRRRVRKYYRRDAEVVYPFVDLETYGPRPDAGLAAEGGDYYLWVGAFAPYKRVDLAIEACNRLNRPLWLVGGGQETARLRKLAGPRTRFLGSVPDGELRKIYAGAKALIFPGEEDFGITPLEAMACGKPVIAYGSGGVTETVVEGSTGLFFDTPSVDALCDAILEFEKVRGRFSPEACRRRAEAFNKDAFKRSFCRIVNRLYAERVSGAPPPEVLPAARLEAPTPGNA